MSLHLLLPPCSSRYAASISRSISHSHLPFYPCRGFSTGRVTQQLVQPQTLAADNIQLEAPVVYISESHDPRFNLSYEDWLLRNTPRNQPVLLFYRNQPCVVIGRNQNPWKETTPRHVAEMSIPLIRRRSGGGTVYHDLGNTNFSLILPRLLFTRRHGAELVSRAVRERLGISGCMVNDRNDIIIRDGGKDFKVSGSAYKIIQHRAYHHGTMLISSSVAELGKALKSDAHAMDTKGVPSFRSPVTTLNTHLPPSRHDDPISHVDFISAVISEFASVYTDQDKELKTNQVVESAVKDPKIWQGYDELKSWNWTYGQSPEFTHTIEGNFAVGDISASIGSRHALITSLTFHLTPHRSTSDSITQSCQAFLDALALALIGKRYESLKDAEGNEGPHFEDDDLTHRPLGDEVVGWLKKAM